MRGLRAGSSGVVVTPPGGLWCVELTNAGNGPAPSVGLSYFAERAGNRVESEEALDVRSVIDALGVLDERDYLLVRLSPGFVLPAAGTQRVFELPLALTRQLAQLGIVVDYAGPFGERTRLRVEAHPPHGPPDPAPTDAAEVGGGR